MAGNTADPVPPTRRSPRNSLLGSATPHRPPSVISNSPSSPVAPKRCLTARRRRRAWWRSPSKLSTVSTTCSSTLGPARAPSLVTWPTRTVVRVRALASATSAWVHALTWVTEPGAASTSASKTVWMRVDDQHVGGEPLDTGGHPLQGGLGHDPHARHQRAQPGRPALDLLWRLLGGYEQAAGPAGGQRGQGLEEESGLADAGLAPERGSPTRGPAHRRVPGRAPPRRSGAGRAVSASTSTRAIGISAGREATSPRPPPPNPVGVPASSISSTRVFHSPQVGHRPAQRGLMAPQSPQRWMVRRRLMVATLNSGCDRQVDAQPGPQRRAACRGWLRPPPRSGRRRRRRRNSSQVTTARTITTTTATAISISSRRSWWAMWELADNACLVPSFNTHCDSPLALDRGVGRPRRSR